MEEEVLHGCAEAEGFAGSGDSDELKDWCKLHLCLLADTESKPTG